MHRRLPGREGPGLTTLAARPRGGRPGAATRHADRWPRLGILGGTFDPIHHGHLLQASEAARALALDQVLFIPAGQPWHKDRRAISPAAHRYAMTAIATAPHPGFVASRIEVDRPGPTYTVDTLEELWRSAHPEAELFLIVGADTLASILTWRHAERLFSLSRLVACSRTGYQLTDPGVPGGVSLVQVPAHGISSTLIRARLNSGAPISHLVPEGVAGYIERQGLYL